MKRIITHYIPSALFFMQLLVCVVFLSSCEKMFDEIRKDPEGVNTANPSSFLSNSLFDVTAALNTQGHTVNDQLMQVNVLKQNDNEIHRYIITPGNSNGMWNSMYKPLADIQEMLKLSEKNGDKNYNAIALTLKSWIVSNITDVYGDVPFTEAVRGWEDITTPKYDPQKQIYDSLLVYLDRANSLYVLGQTIAGEDLLFGANASAANLLKWKKFTNSLRLRLLMRIEKKSAEYQNMITAMLSDPVKYPLMAEVSDGAALYYTGITPFLNPFYGARDFDFNQKLVFSKFFITSLDEVNDPRLAVWASKGTGSVYVGLQTGYPTSSQSEVTNTSYSSYQTVLKTNKLMGSILQYAEVEFLLAEACLKGYMAGDAKTHYDNGIKASMDYWGVTTIPADFLTNPEIAYDGTLKQIITQKYFALFANGFEQWSEYRRTSFPVLPPGIEMSNNGIMPSRLPYPAAESLYNSKNYQEAVSRMGGDDINVKLWWQQ